MDQFPVPPAVEESPQPNVPLKILEVVITIAVFVGVAYYYTFYIKSPQKNPPTQAQSQVQTQTPIQKQTQNAIQKRDATLCPQVNSPFTNAMSADAGCITAVKNLTTLDAVNITIVRAIKEKNTKLCDFVGKDFKDVCVKAVQDAISGTTKIITNPLLGH